MNVEEGKSRDKMDNSFLDKLHQINLSFNNFEKAIFKNSRLSPKKTNKAELKVKENIDFNL